MNKIRETRKKLKINQTTLAQKAHIHRAYLSKVEKGGAVVSVDIALRIAQALGVHVEDIFILSL